MRETRYPATVDYLPLPPPALQYPMTLAPKQLGLGRWQPGDYGDTDLTGLMPMPSISFTVPFATGRD